MSRVMECREHFGSKYYVPRALICSYSTSIREFVQATDRYQLYTEAVISNEPLKELNRAMEKPFIYTFIMWLYLGRVELDEAHMIWLIAEDLGAPIFQNALMHEMCDGLIAGKPLQFFNKDLVVVYNNLNARGIDPNTHKLFLFLLNVIADVDLGDEARYYTLRHGRPSLKIRLVHAMNWSITEREAGRGIADHYSEGMRRRWLVDEVGFNCYVSSSPESP
jgi:hypothetical protein